MCVAEKGAPCDFLVDGLWVGMMEVALVPAPSAMLVPGAICPSCIAALTQGRVISMLPLCTHSDGAAEVYNHNLACDGREV